MRPRAPSAARPRHQHAQQRRHPRRALLSRRHTESAAVRRGAPAAVRVLRAPPHPARALRQARRRARRARDRSSSRRCSSAAPTTASTGLEMVDRAFIVAREPAVNTRFALWSPDSGIVDAEELVKVLLRTGEEEGVIFLPGTRLAGADRHPEGIALRTERETILAAHRRQRRRVCTQTMCRRCSAARRSRSIRAAANTRSSRRQNARSSTRWSIRCRTRRGTASACTWCARPAGRCGSGRRFTTRSARTTTRTIASRSRHFAESARLLIDGVTIDDLRLSGSGIRAKLHPPSESFADFMIRRDRENPAVVQVVRHRFARADLVARDRETGERDRGGNREIEGQKARRQEGLKSQGLGLKVSRVSKSRGLEVRRYPL